MCCAELIDDARIETDFHDLLRTMKGDVSDARIVFDARDFLRDHEPACAGPPLPQNETVTSDSIAARLADVIAADELVLLKSRDALPSATLDQLSAAGYVDSCFPRVARSLNSVRLVNPRAIELAAE